MDVIRYLKKRFGHWTPRYIKNRLLVIINEKLHPDWPWLTRDAILLLEKLLTPDDIGLEFGSGRSTIWFAKRVKRLISIEHDAKWFTFINEQLRRSSLTNVEYYLKKESEYLDIFKNIPNNSIDFVLVDGLFRDICALKSLPIIKNGGLLIIDNINWVIPSASHSPNSRKKDFESLIWGKVWNEIKYWRKIWTTNGVTDTLIAFKP